MTKAIFKGISVDLIGTALLIITGLLVVPIYLKFLTADAYGFWLSISALVGFLGIFDIGTDQYLTTTVANSKIFESSSMEENLFLIVVIKAITVMLIVFFGCVLYLTLTFFIKKDTILTSAETWVFFISVFNLCLTVMLNTIPTILTAKHNYSIVNGVVSASGILAGACGAILLSNGLGIISLPLSISIFLIIQYLFFYLKLTKNYPNVKLRITKFNNKLFIDIVKYGFSFHLVKCVYGIFRIQYIIFLSGIFLGPVFATKLTITNRLPSAVGSNSMKIASAFFPSFAELFVTQDKNSIKNIFFKLNKVLIRFALFAVITLYCVNEIFIDLWVGADFFGGKSVELWLLLYILIYISMGAFGVVVFASKKFEMWPYWLMAEVIVTIILSVTLMGFYELAGVVASLTIGALVSQLYLFSIVKKQLDFKMSELVDGMLGYVFLPTLTTLAGSFLLKNMLPTSNWLALLLTLLWLSFLQLASRELFLILKHKEKHFIDRLIKAFIP
jgi:O-antigen/teichoic acid export membrane protein